MDNATFSGLLTEFNIADVSDYLIELNLNLTNHTPGDQTESSSAAASLYTVSIGQLTQLVEKLRQDPIQYSNVYKLVSQNVALCMAQQPSCVYDFANSLLGHISEEPCIANVILIDLFERFPHNLGSLVTFTVAQIYKLLKKCPSPSSNQLVVLMSVLVKIAAKSDINDKMLAKLTKLVTKGILLPSDHIQLDVYLDAKDANATTVLVKRAYITTLKNLLSFSVSSNYESLLALSTSSTSAGARIKPEQIVTQQNQFQNTMLTTMDKVLMYGLSHPHSEIRVATVDLLASILVNLVDTQKFDGIEYLIDKYPLPKPNHPPGSTNGEDYAAIASSSSSSGEDDKTAFTTLLTQTSVAECIVFYIQLQQLQNQDYLAKNITTILDKILAKFSSVNTNDHLMNSLWSKTLEHWKTVIAFIINESGLRSYEGLVNYLGSKFLGVEGQGGDQQVTDRDSRLKKKDTTIFGFKTSKSKSLKSKDLWNFKPYHNPYHCGLLLYTYQLLIPFGAKLNESSGTKDGASTDETELSQENSFYNILLNLFMNNNQYIRNFALETFLQFFKGNNAPVNSLIITIFNLVSQSFKAKTDEKMVNGKDNTTSLSSIKLMQYSLVLLSLLKQTDAFVLQSSTLVKILSFCTQNLKHTATGLKAASCWTILASVVTFFETNEFVKLNSSQLLVFWKGLLTSQFIPLSTEANDQLAEISGNLRARNTSLICLINYLTTVGSNSNAASDQLKHTQFLLARAYNYVTYLESNIEGLSNITNFDTSATEDFLTNVQVVDNLQFSDYGNSYNISSTSVLASLILYSKKLILFGFSILSTNLKHEINSNLVIFLVKLISDPKLFCFTNSLTSDLKKVKSAETSDPKLTHPYLDNPTTISYGTTTKYTGIGEDIDSLNMVPVTPVSTVPYDYNIINGDVFKASEGTHCLPWYFVFEKTIFTPAAHSIVFDPAVLLFAEYSKFEKFSPCLVTSLIDYSIELFQLVFPTLSEKIQVSLLEQLKNSLTAKDVSHPLRAMAIAINISIALEGVALNLMKKPIDKETVLSIMDILSLLNEKVPFMIDTNTKTFGRCSTLLPVKLVQDEIDKLIGKIVNNTDPHIRGSSVLSLAQVSRFSGIGFLETFNVVVQLLGDPNPVVYHFTLKATAMLFVDGIDNITSISAILEKIYTNFFSWEFDNERKNKTLTGLGVLYPTSSEIGNLIQTIVASLGPSLRELPISRRHELRNLIVYFRLGVGCSTGQEILDVYRCLLELSKELIIFDNTLIESEVDFFSNLVNFVITNNIKVGIATECSVSLSNEAVFPFNTSSVLYETAFGCYTELLKLFGTKFLNKQRAELLWICMALKPCNDLKSFIGLWLDSNSEMNWFKTLNSIFKYSVKKLVSPFIENTYSLKMLPLQQRQKQLLQTKKIDLTDEEVENIVALVDISDDSNMEQVSWEFKLFIFELLNKLLQLAGKSPTLLDQLKSKISDIIKISFTASSSSITCIKLNGLLLLDKCLRLFGTLEDPMYPGTSILDQQQAQIISALVPCFNSDSSADIIVSAINVSSKFINLPRIKFYSKKRILKTLMNLLEEVSSNKYITFASIEDMSEMEKKSLQLSILNCWALLKLGVEDQTNDDQVEDDSEEGDNNLVATLEKYSHLLNPLWILALKDFSSLKHQPLSTREIDIYNGYWINFVMVLCLEMEKNSEFTSTYLKEDEANFLFILFSECIESLIAGKRVQETLRSVLRLMQSKALVDIIFNNEVFSETIDLFDRLLLIEDDTEIQCEVVDIVRCLFDTGFEQFKDDIDQVFDKLFELTRVCLLPLFNILPFLRVDYDPENQVTKLALKHADSASHLVVLKKVLISLLEMINHFDEIVRVDLYSCVLFIFSRIYEFGNELLVAVVLPHLKQVVTEVKALANENELLNTFYGVILPFLSRDKNFSVLTLVILVTSGELEIDETTSTDMANGLLELLSTNPGLSIQCIKSLIAVSAIRHELSVVKFVVQSAVKSIVNGAETRQNPQVLLEVLFLYSQLIASDSTKSEALYGLLVPLLVSFQEASTLSREYLREKLLFLVSQNPESFKLVVSQRLTDTQRAYAQELMSTAAPQTQVVDEDHVIELKTFGV
ncbi:uncharacterized protein KQ657_001804 [Scheffersomyces spartinae]|uniref:LAA1-like C-terminal TPR repeats domain-containing protein n=1 Tax=Scheffersomyces spartinae TaxID=45513 RepID=A0A9P7V718_9ASCO|nr:uncharacterized protein KQ657_001804 [Scheffersomyces spartinae]KAG7192405.1 hypothetical protein KQ657_001804 [Scheffersomyces spartinae]